MIGKVALSCVSQYQLGNLMSKAGNPGITNMFG